MRTYADVMREQQLARERDNTLQNIRDKQRRSVHVLHFFNQSGEIQSFLPGEE